MTGIFEKEITPADCTLALALPLTREEFLADLRPDAPKDYAKFYRSQIWGRPSDEELWQKYRDNFSHLFEAVADDVRARGVKVVRQVKLSDLRALLMDRQVVSLISHWRGAAIEPEDFVSFPSFLEKLGGSSHAVVAGIRKCLTPELAAQMRHLDSHAEVEPFQKQWVDWLNLLLERGNLGNRPGFDETTSEQPLHSQHRSYLNRKTLDEVFPSDLKSGNRMEFFDGLKSAEEIREQIPESFSGFLDLMVCNSVLPGEVIKLMKKNCLVISSQFPANPRFRLLLYKAVIRALDNRPGPYVPTMMEVRQGLEEYLRNHE